MCCLPDEEAERNGECDRQGKLCELGSWLDELKMAEPSGSDCGGLGKGSSPTVAMGGRDFWGFASSIEPKFAYEELCVVTLLESVDDIDDTEAAVAELRTLGGRP